MERLVARLQRRSAVVLSLATALLGVVPAAGAHADVAPGGSLSFRVDEAIAAQAATLEYDADTERSWVQATLTPQGYAGALKGARGTYLTHAGNDVDAALLLGALLDASLVPYRFASCTVSAPALSVPAWDVGQSAYGLDDAAEIKAAVTDPDLQAAVDQVVAQAQTAKTDTQSAAASLAAQLAARPVIPVPSPTSAPASASPAPSESLPSTAPSVTPEPAPPADSQHTWVQVANGPDWRDLDPTTTSGAPPCSPTETLVELPEAWYHHLHVALEVEQRSDGTVSMTDDLNVDLRTADVSVSRIAFGFGERSGAFQPIPWVSGLASYTPVLDVDGQVTRGTSIQLPPTSRQKNPLAGVFGPPTDDPSQDPNPVTGAWLRIDLVDPSGKTTTVRSDVLDRIGYAQRAAGDAATAQLQPLTEVQGNYADTDAGWQIGFLAGENRSDIAVNDGSLDLSLTDIPGSQLDALLRSFPAAYRYLGGHDAGPMLILAGLKPTIDQSGQPATALLLDAASVPGATPVDSTGAAQDAEAVLGAERLLLQVVNEQAVGLTGAQQVFASAAAAGIPLRWFNPGDQVNVSGASPTAIARMQARLAAGFQVLAPSTQPSTGGTPLMAWFAVDPATGVARDEDETGRHDELEEETPPVANATSNFSRFRELACRVMGPAAIVVGILFSATGGQGGGDLGKALAKTAQGAADTRRRGEQATKIACAGQGGQGPPK